jgi:lysyl-tRNA synthetase, class II
VLGRRIHEWHLGAGILLALVVLAALGRVHDGLAPGIAALVGAWLVLKDWHDLVPSRRDTAAWRVGLHSRPAAFRALRRGDALPRLAALAAALAALVNLASAVTPNVAWRHHLLLDYEPLEALRLSHAIAVPASIVLLVAAFYLWRRRRGALRLALCLLVALGVLNLLKGLDIEEAAASFAVAGLLWLGRDSFTVRHDPVTLRSAAWRVPLVAIGTLSLSTLAIWLAAPGSTSFPTVLRDTGDAFLLQPGPLVFHDELGRLDQAIGALGVLMLLVCAYLLFRPLAAPRSLPGGEARVAAMDLVRRYGADTLAYFKLRRDGHYLFSPDGRAFLGYRVDSGVLLVSGDPVGAPDAFPALLRELSAFAECRGLRVAALGVGEHLRAVWAGLGLRALYLGDEAIVDTSSFSLEGRAIRKVRQSVSRLEKQGYSVDLEPVADLDPRTVDELHQVSLRWRQGAPERGFCMALDAVRREDGDTTVAIARDAEGSIRGFIHFVPSYGRAAVSLSSMRRDRSTPNGLNEFLIVKAAELLRAQGVEEVSLNFAAFARWIHSPCNRTERVLGRLLAAADAFFQIESLYRFNAKFFPRWEPRYLMYEGVLTLPRVGLAALWIEGQLPKPALLRR